MSPVLPRRRTLLALLLAPWPWAAGAQTVYRCGPPGARTYSQVPCAGGTTLDVTDPRSPAQQERDRADAEDAAQRIRAQAERMGQDREAEESRARPTAPGSLNKPPPPPEPERDEAEPLPLPPRRRRKLMPPRPRPEPEPAPPPPRKLRLGKGL